MSLSNMEVSFETYLHILTLVELNQTTFLHNSHKMLVSHTSEQQACEDEWLSHHEVLELHNITINYRIISAI
jgi:hypothetical protein